MALHGHKSKSKRILASKMREVHKADKGSGKSFAQKRAIAFSKARKAGARLKKK